MSTPSWADRTRIKSSASAPSPSPQISKASSPLPGSDLRDSLTSTSQSSTATTATSRMNSSTTPSTPASAANPPPLKSGDGDCTSPPGSSPVETLSRSHKEAQASEPSRVAANGDTHSTLPDQSDKSDQSTQRTSPAPSSISTLPPLEATPKTMKPDPSGPVNVWQIRKAELSRRYQSNITASSEAPSKSTSSSNPPDSVKPDRPPFSVPGLSSSVLGNVVDTSAWPAPSEEPGLTSPDKHKASSPTNGDSKVNGTTDSRPRGTNGKKIQWKAIPANITHNAPLPTNHPASARNRNQHRRESHPQGSRNQGPRSSSTKTSSNNNGTVSNKSRKNSAPSVRTASSVSGEKSVKHSTGEKSRIRLEASQSAATDASREPQPGSKARGTTEVTTARPIDQSQHQPSIDPIKSQPVPTSLPENTGSGASAGSVSNRKPGFIPRISPTIQPPAMALSAGPARSYIGLAPSFHMTDYTAPTSSGPLPHYRPADGMGENCQPRQKAYVDGGVSSALSELHINAPQGNVWVNDPLVMSDGSAPVVLASADSERSAAITFDSSSLENLQPSQHTSATSSNISPKVISDTKTESVNGGTDSNNNQATINGIRLSSAQDQTSSEPQTSTARQRVLQGAVNRPEKLNSITSNHNSMIAPNQAHAPVDLGPNRLPRKPRDVPLADPASSMGGLHYEAPGSNTSREHSHRKSFNSSQSGKGHHSNRLGSGGGVGRNQGGSRNSNWRAVYNGSGNAGVAKGRDNGRSLQPGRSGSLKSPEDQQHYSWVGAPQYQHHGQAYHNKYGMAPEHHSPTSNSSHYASRYAGVPESPGARPRTLSSGSLAATGSMNHGVHMGNSISGNSQNPPPPRFYAPPHNPFPPTHYSQPPSNDYSYSDPNLYPMQTYYYPSPVPHAVNELPLDGHQASGVQIPHPYPGYDPQERPAPLSAYPYSLDPLRYYVLGQCEYYFSVDNLVKDQFLRFQMDDMGWVKIETIASFNRIRSLTGDLELICEVMNLSPCLDVDVERKLVRKRGDWAAWLLPPRQQVSSNFNSELHDHSKLSLRPNGSEVDAQDKESRKAVPNECEVSSDSQPFQDGAKDLNEVSDEEVCTSSEKRSNSGTASEGKSGLKRPTDDKDMPASDPLSLEVQSQSNKQSGGEDKSSSGVDTVVTISNNRGQPTISIGFDPKTGRPGQTSKPNLHSGAKRLANR